MRKNCHQQIAYEIIFDRLKQGAVDIDELTSLLESKEVEAPMRTAKEISWRMVEEGVAQFNNEWFLELK